MTTTTITTQTNDEKKSKGDRQKALRVFLVCFLIWFATCQCACTALVVPNASRALHEESISDVIFTENVLFEQEVTSAEECLLLCHSEGCCATFTFTALTSSSGICRGHSSIMTSRNAHVVTSDTKAFRTLHCTATAWLQTNCSNNTECWRENSECFADQCLCSPGYYYSISSDSCVSSCPTDMLTDQFVAYARRRIKNNNDKSLRDVDLNDCILFCRSRATCRTVDYKSDPRRCHAQTVTKLDLPDSDWSFCEHCVSYQRVCP